MVVLVPVKPFHAHARTGVFGERSKCDGAFAGWRMTICSVNFSPPSRIELHPALAQPDPGWIAAGLKKIT
jgi:hypothetical protein